LPLSRNFTLAVPEAKLGYTEVKIGFLPAIVSVFSDAADRRERSRDLLLTGRVIEATEAKEFGLVSEIVPLSDLWNAHIACETADCGKPQPYSF